MAFVLHEAAEEPLVLVGVATYPTDRSVALVDSTLEAVGQPSTQRVMSTGYGSTSVRCHRVSSSSHCDYASLGPAAPTTEPEHRTSVPDPIFAPSLRSHLFLSVWNVVSSHRCSPLWNHSH